jgi:hypothetical protein
MKLFLSLLSGLTLGAVFATELGLRVEPAQAQPAYGSYIGAAVGIGQRNEANNNLDFTAVAAGRYKLLELPISLRSQVFVDAESLAWIPTVSYDLPLTWQLEPYIGAGVAFTSDGSIVGDKTSFVLQPGVDYAIPNSRMVLFGNAVIAIDAFDDGDRSGETAVSVQTGIGYRF